MKKLVEKIKGLFPERLKQRNTKPETPSAPAGESWQAELRCRGRRVQTVTLDRIGMEISIGKAADNFLRLPDADRSSGQHHAKLYLVSGGVKAAACENCRIHFRGESLAEVVLKKGGRISLGDSELLIKPLAESERLSCDVHRLEVCGGEKDGNMIRLEKSPFRIGSAPDNDLVLKSDVISRYHAEIRIAENGETWMKDLRSSNGTFVNGEQLGRQERMLMDSDEISVACFDYRFLDRNVVHTRTHWGRKMLVMGATVLLVLLGFGLFYLVAPSTEKVVGVIDFYLKRNNYDAAERILKKMPDSRGFQQYEKQYREYRVQIPRYRRTFEALTQFQSALAQSDWNDAVESYGKLELYEPDAWNQADPATAVRQQEIRHAKELLDMLLALKDAGTSLNTSVAELEIFWKKMLERQKAFNTDFHHDPEYLKPLHQSVAEQMAQLEFNIRSIREISTRMAQLAENGSTEQLTEFIRTVEQGRSRFSGSVRVYIRDLLNLLQAARNNMRALDANEQALFDLRAADVRPVELISSDDCMKFLQLYQLRVRMEQRLKIQLQCRDNWQGLQKQLRGYHLVPGRMPEEVPLFSDEKFMEKTIAEAGSSPMGEYNRIFGERYFYEVLQQTVHTTNNIYASDLIPDMKTVPLCIRLKDLYRGVSEALVWFRLPQNQWLLHGRMKEMRDYYQRILDTRQSVLRSFRNIASRNRDNRKYFIAKAAYFFFAPVQPGTPEEMRKFAEEWRKFRLEQLSGLEQYDIMNEQKFDRLKQLIIETGIPGDPVFNWMRSVK